MIQLRPYQEQAISTITQALMQEPYVLAQLPTGAGKTIIFSELIKQFLTQYHMRILILAHRQILVKQAQEKLLQVWQEAEIGVACASLSSVSLDAPVVVASVQTLVSRLDQLKGFDLVIVDEAHHLPPPGKKSQYRKLFDKLHSINSQMRLLGVTATPYRLGTGYIFGDKKLFKKLNYHIGINDLQKENYLVPMRLKEAANIDLSSIRQLGSGDYNEGDLEKLLTRNVHIQTAVDAYKEYGENRQHTVVFAVTIKHAEVLTKAFKAAGYQSECIHSQLSNDQNTATLADFERGKIQILVNVGVLTEGWDAPTADCILFCRPTLSPSLYIQMLGRGLRPAQNKKDLLVLDISGNCMRHGDPDEPLVATRKGKSKKMATGVKPTLKKCPKCHTLVPLSAVECSECGYIWEIKLPQPLELVEHQFEETMNVWNVEITNYITKSGKKVIRVATALGETIFNLKIANEFLDFDNQLSQYGKYYAQKWWHQNISLDAPQNRVDAINRASEFIMPEKAVVKLGKYLKVMRYIYGVYKDAANRQNSARNF